MGMGLSVSLNPNGVGLQTALKAPLLARDPFPSNALGGFVNAMGSMQGNPSVGPITTNPGVGPITANPSIGPVTANPSVGLITANPGLGALVGNLGAGEGAGGGGGGAGAPDNKEGQGAVMSISGIVSTTENAMKSASEPLNSHLAKIETGKVSTNTSALQLSADNTMAVSSEASQKEVSAVSVNNDGLVQTLSVKNCSGPSQNSNSPVILSISSSSTADRSLGYRTVQADGSGTDLQNGRRRSETYCNVASDAPRSQAHNSVANKLIISREQVQEHKHNQSRYPPKESPTSDTSEESLVPIIV